MRLVSLLLLVLIRGYQVLVSPFFPPSCRYWPSCSEYARQAVAVHGPARGSWLTLRRLLRCHPWGGWGYDPVPEPQPEMISANTASVHTGPAQAAYSAKSAAGLGLCPGCRHLDEHSGR